MNFVLGCSCYFETDTLGPCLYGFSGGLTAVFSLGLRLPYSWGMTLPCVPFSVSWVVFSSCWWAGTGTIHSPVWARGMFSNPPRQSPPTLDSFLKHTCWSVLCWVAEKELVQNSVQFSPLWYSVLQPLAPFICPDSCLYLSNSGSPLALSGFSHLMQQTAYSPSCDCGRAWGSPRSLAISPSTQWLENLCCIFFVFFGILVILVGE